MSRKEAILLVSRALAMIQLICAFMELTYIPVRFISLLHHTNRISVLGSSGYDDFWSGYYHVDIAFLLARILVYMIFAFLFWNCGPWVERVLLPKCEDQDKTA